METWRATRAFMYKLNSTPIYCASTTGSSPTRNHHLTFLSYSTCTFYPHLLHAHGTSTLYSKVHVQPLFNPIAPSSRFCTTSRMLAPAIRYVAQKGPKVHHALVSLSCSVKPGVSATREGITAVSENSIELCVAAQAREGDANLAVKELIAKTLKVHKSDVNIARGQKSRSKVVEVKIAANEITTPEEEVERIKIILQRSVPP